jgi:hypothetical protein
LTWILPIAAGGAHPDSSATTTLEIAIAAGVVLTFVSVPYKDYSYQFRWAKFAASVVYLLFLAVGALAGWAGFVVGRSIGWHPVPESQVATGIIYGALGLGIVRVRLDKLPSDAEDALTPISIVGDWLTDSLKDHVPNAVLKKLYDLTYEELAQYTSLLFKLKVSLDVELPEEARKQLGKLVKSSAHDVLYGSKAKKIDGWSTLMRMGQEWVPKYRFGPPHKRRVEPA